MTLLFTLMFPVIPLILLCISIAIPLWGLHGRQIARMLLWQLLFLVAGAAIGFTLIGNAIFEATGGCAAHGGGFEGACGYAGIGYDVFAAIITALIAPLIGGLTIRLIMHAPRQEGDQPTGNSKSGGQPG